MISAPFARHLAAAATDRQRWAHCPCTVKARESAVRLFLAFCQRIRVHYKTISHLHVCWYIEYLTYHNSSPASISNAVSHLRTFYTMAGLSNRPLFHNRVLLALRAISITLRHVPTPRDPVTPQLLKAALQNVDRLPNAPATCLALLLMFMGFLHQSWVAPPAVPKFDPTRHLTHGDITVGPTGLKVRIKWTKTLQSSADATSIILPATQDHAVCPVRAYRTYMNAFLIRPAPADPLLSHSLTMTIPYIRRQWATLLAIIGKSTSQYSLHSLRKGAAQFTYNDCDADLNDVMHQGTWRSAAVRAYIRPDQSAHTSVHRALAQI